jgi:hypothetical protein
MTEEIEDTCEGIDHLLKAVHNELTAMFTSH